MTPRVFSYIRFSSPEQSLGDSANRQRAKAAEWAAKHGMEIDEELRVDAGLSAYSGTHLKRGALGDFIRKVEAGKIAEGSVLVVESLDRLSRQSIDVALMQFISLIHAGVDVVTLLPEITRHTRESIKNLITLLSPLVAMSTAHEESGKKAGRVADGWAAKRREMQTNPTLYTSRSHAWLKWKGRRDAKGDWEQGGKWTVIPEQADKVRLIYKLYAQGLGKEKIAKHLNQNGINSFRKGAWSKSQVGRLLITPAAYGDLQLCRYVTDTRREKAGEDIKGYFPRIIDNALLAKVRKRQSETVTHFRWTRTIHLLSGLLWDVNHPHCRMYIFNKGQSRNWVYAVSQRSMTVRDYKHRVKYNDLEGLFLKVFYELDWSKLSEEAKPGALLELEEKANSTQISLADTRNKQRHLLSVIEAGKAPSSILAARMLELEKEEASQLKQLEDIERLADAERHAMPHTNPKRPKDLKQESVRLAIREQIRERVQRIEVFAKNETSDPAFVMKIVFKNKATRWVEQEPVSKAFFVLDTGPAPQ
jgi:DNA invertase Pin-like site-specific DNA recombinase